MTASYPLLYLEINLASVVLVGIVLLKSKGLSKMQAQRYFELALWSEILFFLSDTFYVLFTCGVLPGNDALRLAMKELYFLSTVTLCYFWFLYFELLQESSFIKQRRLGWVCTILLWVMIALLIVNIPTGIFFYIDKSGTYCRGTLFVLQYIIAYSYIIAASAHALIRYIRKDASLGRSAHLAPILFPIAPAAAGIIQFAFPQYPVACVVLALCTLIMYLNWTDEMISIDPLTKLNNRKYLKYVYEQWQKNGSEEAPMFLLLIDANKFKGINDTYGHVQGDNALKRIAEAMRLSCHRIQKKTSVTRYGGDEFVILVEAEEAVALELKTSINRNLAELNEKSDVPCPVTVSIGIARASKDKNLKALITDADEGLYQEKKQRGSAIQPRKTV